MGFDFSPTAIMARAEAFAASQAARAATMCPSNDPRSADEILAEIAREIERHLEPQTAHSEGFGSPWFDFARISDLADLAYAERLHFRRRAMDAVDHLIALLDALDLDTEDMEAEEDRCICDEGHDEDPDQEPSLGALENHPNSWPGNPRRSSLGDQTDWCAGSSSDREDEHDGREHEAGYDLPEGDDERCASDDVDGERSLGWSDNESQLRLRTDSTWNTEDAEETAPERHGKGFVRSGPEDTEDDELGEEHEPNPLVWVFGVSRRGSTHA